MKQSFLKSVVFLLAMFAAFLITSACARTVVPAEVLQIPEHADVYTQYNLWYEDPMNISSQNIQKGTILPFGTRVSITRASDKAIEFTAVDDKKQFRIKYDPQFRMQPVETYLKELFSEKDQDELATGIRALTFEKLKRGLVEKGMTRGEVLLAFGPPCAFKTPDRNADTWVFWSDFLAGKRIVFNNNSVVEIIVLR